MYVCLYVYTGAETEADKETVREIYFKELVPVIGKSEVWRACQQAGTSSEFVLPGLSSLKDGNPSRISLVQPGSKVPSSSEDISVSSEGLNRLDQPTLTQEGNLLYPTLTEKITTPDK